MRYVNKEIAKMDILYLSKKKQQQQQQQFKAVNPATEAGFQIGAQQMV